MGVDTIPGGPEKGGIITEPSEIAQGAPGPDWRSTNRRVTLASFFGFASLAMAYSPTLSLYAKDLGASPWVAGILFSVAPTFGILLRIPAGALSTLIGRKRLLTVGATTYLLAPLVLLTTESLPVVFLSAFLFGFANLYMPAGISLVNDVVPEAERGKYIAYYAMWGTLGRAGAPFLAGFLIDEMGYRYVFIVCAGMGLVSFLYTLLLPPSKGEASPERSISRQVLRDLKLVVRHPKLLWASVFRGSQSLTQGIMNSYFPWYARDVAGLGAAAIGQIQTGLVLGGIFARPVTGKFSSGRRRIPFIVGGMLGSAVLLFLVTRTTDYFALMAICFGLGIVEGVCQIATVAYLSDAAGVRMFGAAIGVLGGFFDLGLVGGRLVPGMLLPAAPLAAHYALAFGIIGAVVGGAGVCVPFLLRGSAGPPPESDQAAVREGLGPNFPDSR